MKKTNGRVYRIIQGASWSHKITSLLSMSVKDSPTDQFYALGFRLTRPV